MLRALNKKRTREQCSGRVRRREKEKENNDRVRVIDEIKRATLGRMHTND